MIDLQQRDFYLKNKDGEIRNLLYDNGGNPLPPFLNTPNGLGFEFDVDFREIETSRVITDIRNNYVDITGELIFPSYGDYRDFVLWVERSQTRFDVELQPENVLRLYYTTNNDDYFSDAYYDVFISKIEKSEKTFEDGLLRCNVTFKKLSNIKKDYVYSVSNFGDAPPAPTFPLPTPGSNHIVFSPALTNEVTMKIPNPSNMTIPVQIKFKGLYTNPYWENKANGLKGKYMVQSLLQSSYILADARPLAKVIHNGINAFDKCSPYYENLLLLEPGMNEIKIILNDPYNGTVGVCEVTIEGELEAFTI
jgi:hypothetical protein